MQTTIGHIWAGEKPYGEVFEAIDRCNNSVGLIPPAYRPQMSTDEAEFVDDALRSAEDFLRMTASFLARMRLPAALDARSRERINAKLDSVTRLADLLGRQLRGEN